MFKTCFLEITMLTPLSFLTECVHIEHNDLNWCVDYNKGFEIRI